MRRLALPGRRPDPYHRSLPLLAACVAAVLTVGMSSVKLPDAEPPEDGALLAVERAWRAEFSPGAPRTHVRRSAIWRVTATFGRNLSPTSPWYLVVGSEPGTPERLDVAAIDAGADSGIEAGRPSVAPPTDPDRVAVLNAPPQPPRWRHRAMGAPDWQDAGGWNAWRLAGFAPGSRTTAISLDAAAVDSLGSWLGLFDASGRRVAVARLAEEGR
jgi:hypothetical protein